MDIVLIGSGNVATHLGNSLQAAGHRIVQVYSRTKAHADALASVLQSQPSTTDELSELHKHADIYLIAVSDRAIGSVISALPSGIQGIVAHTSGSTPIAVFENYPDPHGVFYPVQTFSIAKSVDFAQVPIALEASSEQTYETLAQLGNTLSNRVFACDSKQRLAIHIAAVFACNFTNYLYAIGEDVLQAEGLDFDLIRPLIQETADKIQQHSPNRVQTGPAHRNDQVIVQRHIDYLANKDQAQLKELYALISSLITQKAL